MVPLYILGLLLRYGPQHGYQIKQKIAEQLSDFTEIKLPTVYYHLGKMASDGLLTAASEKPGKRPEKTVYSVTDQGRSAYREMLKELLQTEYRPTFQADGIFFFAEHYETKELKAYLQTVIEKLNHVIAALEQHEHEALTNIPDDAKTMAGIIFSHHLHHYRAELAWMEETLHTLI